MPQVNPAIFHGKFLLPKMCKTDLARHGLKTDAGASRVIDAAAGFSGTEASQRLVESVLSGEGGRIKKASELWHIHGKRFDLSGFLNHHPVRSKEESTVHRSNPFFF